MMNKESQSILDLMNIFPLQSIRIQRSPISNKEANTLFNIWKCAKDEYGNCILADNTNIDPTTIAALTSKGLVKSKLPNLSMGQHLIEITDKGQEVIRNIILSEKSAFEKSSEIINYEAICQRMDPFLSKSASTQNLSQLPQKSRKRLNWLQRALWKSF